jgi:hypothetical protein
MSNGSVAAITPQTAPRDPEGLKKIGIFQLRMLTEKLCGGTMPEQQKMAYGGMTIDQKVAMALDLLRQWDQANPGAWQGGQVPQQQAPQQMQAPPQQMMPPPHMNGTANGAHAIPMGAPAMNAQPLMGSPMMPFQNGQGGMPMPQQQQMPMQQMPMMGMTPPPGMQQVDPSQLAAASQAAQPATTTKERKPRNSSAEKNDPDLGAEVLKLLSTISQTQAAQGEAIVAALKEVMGALDESKKSNDLKAEVKALSESYSGVYGVLKTWDAKIDSIQRSTNLAVALSLFLAEQVLQTPRQDVLQIAVGEIPSIVGMLQVSPGKA